MGEKFPLNFVEFPVPKCVLRAATDGGTVREIEIGTAVAALEHGAEALSVTDAAHRHCSGTGGENAMTEEEEEEGAIETASEMVAAAASEEAPRWIQGTSSSIRTALPELLPTILLLLHPMVVQALAAAAAAACHNSNSNITTVVAPQVEISGLLCIQMHPLLHLPTTWVVQVCWSRPTPCRFRPIQTEEGEEGWTELPFSEEGAAAMEEEEGGTKEATALRTRGVLIMELEEWVALLRLPLLLLVEVRDTLVDPLPPLMT